MSGKSDRSTERSAEADSLPTISPGILLANKYEVLSIIGKGGMGTVYRVKQILLGKDFALKVLDFHEQSDVAVRRFHLEARTTAQLRHANLAEVHDFGVFADGQPYLIMDYIEGQTLAQVLKRTGALSVDYVVALAVQVGFALMYAHSKGVVHRDIKPGNIIVLHPGEQPVEGTVKVVDFGIAKLMQSEDGQIQELTKTGELFGSPIYMSPEQCKGATIDQRSDIYSLGCVIFECLTGSPPFLAENAMSTMVKRLTEKPVSLKEGSLGLDFPPLLENIVGKALAVNPDDRYREFGAMIKDLMQLQLDRNTAAPAQVVHKNSIQRSNSLLSTRELFLVGMTALICCPLTIAINRVLRTRAGAEQSNPKSALVQPQKSDSIAFMSVDSVLGEKLQIPTREVAYVQGQKKEILHFPANCGRIKVGNNPQRVAQGDVLIPDEEQVTIELNDPASGDARVLENLSAVNFSSIAFQGKIYVLDSCIDQLENIKHFVALSLTGSDISTLRPIYNARYLRVLDVMETHLPDEELLKLKNFPILSSLSFGPLKDPSIVLRELVKTKTLERLHYRGTVPIETYWSSRGINSGDVDLIVQLSNLSHLEIENSPKFDEACLRKLRGLENLKSLVIRDCSISPAAIPILKSFRLESLYLGVSGWSKGEKERLKSLPYHAEVDKLTLEKNAERRADEVNAVKNAAPVAIFRKEL